MDTRGCPAGRHAASRLCVVPPSRVVEQPCLVTPPGIEIRGAMLVLSPLDPLELGRPDDSYAAEAAAADRLTILSALIDHDAVVRVVSRACLRAGPPQGQATAPGEAAP